MSCLAERLQARNVSRTDERELRRYRKFYLAYPQIRDSLNPELTPHTLSPSGVELLSNLSFTAFRELLQIDDPLKRAFYELESIRGGWSVRELRRQIATLLYERTGLKNMMQAGDNPPIGILLCTKKSAANNSMVEYALAGMDNQLFVSRYAVELPKKEEMERVLTEWTQG